MTTAFPLLRLPYLVLLPVLEQMELKERIALSVLSKRARMFLKLLKMKCKYINLILDSGRLEMKVFSDKSEELTVVMYIDEYQLSNMIYRYEGYFTWCNGGPLPVDYAVSIMDVMHCKSINQFIVQDIAEHDCIPIVAKLSKIDEVIVEHISPPNFLSIEALLRKEKILLKVLKIVLPVSSAVTISYHALKPEDLREIIRGNFESVTVRKYSADYMPNHDMKFSLNDLRMTNVRSLEIAGPAFTLEDLNHYFKLWMKKKCDPRLEYLQVATRRWLTVIEIRNLLLKGLNAILHYPIRTDRTFRVLGNLKQVFSEVEDETPFWELDITRADGKTATIRIGSHGTVCFYVCPESPNNTTNLEPSRSSFARKLSFISTFYNSCVNRFK
ncbi:hypothetical protein CRE_10462 [Caenorhabditis remanei]|uniref:F-box domain-containing protein n=1 Tax=Caenorhabditis remanei TaxID=31234 RepID=E3N0M4_CAERE|nr:hypothetical protein CRE_10462 [Caenorhabditis remanei]